MSKSSASKKRPAPAPKQQPPIDLDLEINDVRVTPGTGNGTGKATGAKNRHAVAIRETEVLDAVSGLNLDSVSGTLATTQVEVQKSLADLSGKLVEQLQLLRNVEDAIALKREELKQLYDIEAAEIELDDLKAEIDAQREAWDEEQARKLREFAEMQSERNKQWVRAEEEYQYRLVQEHKKAEDAFKARMEEQEKANRNRQETLEKGWAEREGNLKRQEKEVEDLRVQVANHPELVRKAENAAVAVATNSVKKEYETKIVLATKDAETSQRLAAQEVASLKQAYEKAQAQITDIKTQLDQSHRDVMEIYAKALESASGRSAMEALQKVLEKEPNYKPGK